MKINPRIIIADLEEYLQLFNISLSEEVNKTLMEIEEFAYRCDNPCTYRLFFSKVIKNSKEVQNVIIKKGANPNLVALVLEKDYYDCIDEMATYKEDSTLYSRVYMRKNSENTAIIDKALEYCVRNNRNVIENTDVFLAAMDDYERVLEEDGGEWTDKNLNNRYVTLSHLHGWYQEDLWIKFDDIREDLLSGIKVGRNVKVA